MARCDNCGTTILFGGVHDGNYRFCNEECRQRGYLLNVANQVPYDILAEHVAEVHQGLCPKCNGPGPVDVHTSHMVWSALVLTSWHSTPQLSCRSCGVKAKLGGALISGLVGWWGFPWGLVVTPLQIGRNFVGLFTSPSPTQPSAQLANMVRLHLAAQYVEASRQNQAGEP